MIIRETQKIEIASKPQNIKKVEVFIDEICDYFNVNNDYFGNIIVAVTEAVNNAIVHGNKSDEAKKVTVAFELIQGCVTFTVTDEGMGFNPNAVPDPTDPATESADMGRGLYLMKSLSDGLEFSDNGSTVQIRFAVSSIHKELANRRVRAYQDFVLGKAVKQEKK